MAKVLLSAAHKSSGKTTLSVGIVAALARQGKSVQTYKKGPDYIDPLWLSLASGRPCYNLDFNTQSHREISQTFNSRKQMADLALVEANKGLYDGLDLTGSDSNAALAEVLDLPVILVVDVRGITRGIAPLLLGYQDFGPGLTFGGVILNKTGGSRHEAKLRRVVEHYTQFDVIGAIGYDPGLLAPERHLGLVPPNEQPAATATVDYLAKIAADCIDLDKITAVARRADQAATIPPQGSEPQDRPSDARRPGDAVSDQSVRPINISSPVGQTGAVRRPVRIGIAQDAAFGFYYADDLAAFKTAGAELVFFDALHDPALPDIDGLFIGGGFPEASMAALSDNQNLLADIRQKGHNGLPIYAECGGLMYLSRQISWRDQTRSMVGLVPGDIVMHDRPQGRGLVRLCETGQQLWRFSAPGHDDHQDCGPDGRSDCGTDYGQGGGEIRAHEFHYASLENLPKDARFAFRMTRGYGIDGVNDGYLYQNIHAGFCHLRHTGHSPWVAGFVQFVAGCLKSGQHGSSKP